MKFQPTYTKENIAEGFLELTNLLRGVQRFVQWSSHTPGPTINWSLNDYNKLGFKMVEDSDVAGIVWLELETMPNKKGPLSGKEKVDTIKRVNDNLSLFNSYGELLTIIKLDVKEN